MDDIINLILKSVFVDNMVYMDGVKIGVLSGSLLSTIVGFVLLLMSSKKK